MKQYQTIYKTVINHLQKHEHPIEYNIDQIQSFAWPICTQRDFEERYNDFTLLVGRHRNEPTYIYSNKTMKTGHINSVKFTIDDKSMSIGEYINTLLLQKEEYDEEFGEEYDEEFGEEYDEEFGEEYDEEFGEEYDEEYDEECAIINNITNELEKFYKMNIYLSMGEKEGLPIITIQVDQYNNTLDANGNITTNKQLKPIIIKPSFSISNSNMNFDDYMMDFVNFLNRISPNHDCLDALRINNKYKE